MTSLIQSDAFCTRGSRWSVPGVVRVRQKRFLQVGVKSFGIHLWSVLEPGFLSCTLSRAQTRKNWRQDPLPLEWSEWKEQTDPLPKLYICENNTLENIDNQSKKESFWSTSVIQNLWKANIFSWLVISCITFPNSKLCPKINSEMKYFCAHNISVSNHDWKLSFNQQCNVAFETGYFSYFMTIWHYQKNSWSLLK